MSLQACPSPQLALLNGEDELAQALAKLKHHEISYVAAIMRLREEFLSQGRTKADVEEKKAELKVKSKRAYACATMPELAAALRLVCFGLCHHTVALQPCELSVCGNATHKF